MMKLIMMTSSLIAANYFNWIDLRAIPHLGEYAMALLISMALMPWVASQFDT